MVVAEPLLGVLFSRGLTGGEVDNWGIITISLVKGDVVIASEREEKLVDRKKSQDLARI